MKYRQKLYEKDIISVHAKKRPDLRFYDGGLAHVKGVKNFEVVRVCREVDYSDDDLVRTYNHAPMLTYWNENFITEYLSNEKSEHVPPSQTLLCYSGNGKDGSKPITVFPSIKVVSEEMKDVDENFESLEELPRDWNIYRPKWNNIGVANAPNLDGKA